jgi:hypothetical protein
MKLVFSKIKFKSPYFLRCLPNARICYSSYIKWLKYVPLKRTIHWYSYGTRTIDLSQCGSRPAQCNWIRVGYCITLYEVPGYFQATTVSKLIWSTAIKQGGRMCSKTGLRGFCDVISWNRQTANSLHQSRTYISYRTAGTLDSQVDVLYTYSNLVMFEYSLYFMKITSIIEQNSSWEANNRSGGQEIPCRCLCSGW